MDVVWRIDVANAGTPTTGGAAREGTHPFSEFGISLFRVRAPSYISSCVHFKIPIIVGTAGGHHKLLATVQEGPYSDQLHHLWAPADRKPL